MSDLLRSILLATLIVSTGPALAQDASGSAEDGGTADQENSSSAPARSDETGDRNDTAPETSSDAAGGEPAPAPPSGPDNLSMGEPAGEGDGPGTSYVSETFGDWEQRCVRSEEGADPCQLYQLLRDESGNAVAEMSVFPLPSGREAAAGSTIITPLETLLTRNVRLSIDDGEARQYPFEFCTRQGCIARIGLTAAEVTQFERGAAGTLVIVPAAAPDQEISLTISLSGFTAGYASVSEANASVEPPAPE